MRKGAGRWRTRAAQPLPDRGGRAKAARRDAQEGGPPCTTGLLLVAAATALIAVLGWFFFGPRRTRTARVEGGVQRAEVTVHGGYSPDRIRVHQGLPVKLVCNRQEAGEGTFQGAFARLRTSAALPAYTRTTVRLNPPAATEFGFACGMNVVHGTLLVEPDGTGSTISPCASRCRCSRDGSEGRGPGGSGHGDGRAARGDRRPYPTRDRWCGGRRPSAFEELLTQCGTQASPANE
ncbi:cupredoxin domain-containing protein [Streptomyces rimosus]|uniref:cupredoxin domain-containing protein n=1 Tax=Streptomyces rimosus TaxID=1927 RepID=UPI0037A84AC0